VLCLSNLWSPHMAYWAIGLTVFSMAFNMGSVLAPATDSVMGSVDEAKAGVASAMNDLTRQVAGALGVAVIGSLAQTIYASRVGGKLPALPAPARTAAEGSIGAAHGVAAQLPAPLHDAVISASGSAFTDALAIGLTLAATVSVAVGIIVTRRLPAHHVEPASDTAVNEPAAIAA
jgi:hypothetical protein